MEEGLIGKYEMLILIEHMGIGRIESYYNKHPHVANFALMMLKVKPLLQILRCAEHILEALMPPIEPCC